MYCSFFNGSVKYSSCVLSNRPSPIKFFKIIPTSLLLNLVQVFFYSIERQFFVNDVAVFDKNGENCFFLPKLDNFKIIFLVPGFWR